jgi:trigger factor
LKVDIEELPGSKRQLRVEVPAETFQEDIEAAYKKYKSSIAIPGFRRGKAPLKLLKARFGKAIQQEVFSDIIPDLYKQALDTEHLTPIAEPEVTIEEYEEGQPLVFTAIVEVSPHVAVGGYKELEVVKTVYEVSDTDVDEHIERLRRQAAEERSLDRPAAMGEFLLSDLQELDTSGIPIIGRKTENVLVELGGEGSPGPEFDEQLVGVSRGDERRVRFAYREDYPDERLAGQDRMFSVTVKEVRERILPALDDEFARDLEYESLEDLRTKAREGLEAQASYLSDQGVRSEVINRLIAMNPFDVPESMIEGYLQNAIDNQKETTISPDQEAEMRALMRGDALRRIKSYLILRSIADAEGIEVSDEDVEQRIQTLAEANDMGVNELKRSLRRNNELENIKESLLEEKTWAFLMQQIKIEEAAPVPLWVSPEQADAAEGESE